jgi:hypothetical protein
MAISGKSSISIRKKDLQNQKSLAVGAKNLVAYHKATLGDTGIDLSSLTLPSSEMPSAVNPTAAELAAAKLFFNRKNLTLISSSKGVLMDYLSYSIPSSTRINFEGFAAEDGEIFTIIINPVVTTGMRAVDASSIVATNTLSAGNTEFNVGVPFELNKYPNDQIGAVLVFVDGILQFRNVGNEAASPTADGNYQEVDNGGSTSILIKFNTSSTTDREVVVLSNGVLVDRPDDSRDAVIETQQATLDQVVEDLAAATGNPESRYQASPSQADLKQFGNRVFQNEEDIADHETRVSDLESRDMSTPSMIRLSGGDGRGGSSSGDTRIRNFVNVISSVGSAITRTVRTATTGDYFTINEDGIYAIYFMDVMAGASTNLGISLNCNATNTSTNIDGIPAADRLAIETMEQSGFRYSVSTTVYLQAGDIVRAHTTTAITGSATDANCMFTITQVAKL